MAVLERRGSTFSDLTLTQFDDPLLTEHIMFLAVVDIPRHVSVSYSLSVLLCLCLPLHLLSLLSLALSLQPQLSLHWSLHSYLSKQTIIHFISLCKSLVSISAHQMVEFSTAKLMVHVFQLHEDGPAAEELDSSCDTSAASNWMLPNREQLSNYEISLPHIFMMLGTILSDVIQ